MDSTLGSMTVQALKDALREKALPTSGNKEELIGRLLAASQAERAPSDDDGDDDQDEDDVRRAAPAEEATEAQIRQTQKRIELLKLQKAEAQLRDEVQSIRSGAASPPLARGGPDIYASLFGDQSRQPRFDSAGAQRPPSALLIPEFLDERQQSGGWLTQERGRLTLKGATPSLSGVNFGQWVAANARIMQRLLETGQLVAPGTDGQPDCKSLNAYLNFNIHIGELIDAGYDWKVVLQYDQDMRLQQHSRQRDWDSPDLNLIIKHMTAPKNLRAAGPVAVGQGVQGHRSRGQLSSAGQVICGLFNSNKGCHRHTCNFAHICRICEGSHSKLQHSSVAAESKN